MITFHKGEFVRKRRFPYYSWIPKRWEVKEDDNHKVGFENWENAIIYEKLIEIQLNDRKRKELRK